MKKGLLVFLTISMCLISGPSHKVMAWTHVMGEDACWQGAHGNLDGLKFFIISDRALVDWSSTNFSIPGYQAILINP